MKLIAVVDENWGIGRYGGLLFRLPPDLKHFKQITMGGVLIMGRKTLESLPGGNPLPERTHIILTRGATLPEGCIPCPGLEALPKLINAFAKRKIFVAGGAQIYQALFPYCEEALITHVYADGKPDRYLPNLAERPDWSLADCGPRETYQELTYAYATYKNHAPLSYNSLVNGVSV